MKNEAAKTFPLKIFSPSLSSIVSTMRSKIRGSLHFFTYFFSLDMEWRMEKRDEGEEKDRSHSPYSFGELVDFSGILSFALSSIKATTSFLTSKPSFALINRDANFSLKLISLISVIKLI